MKKITVITSILLVVIMTITLTACGGSSGVVGNWKVTIDMSKVASSMPTDGVDETTKTMLEQLVKAYDGVTVDMKMDLSEDKKAKVGFDESTVDAAKAKIKENMKSLLPDVFKALGATDYQAALAAMGTTEDAFIDNMLSSMDLSKSFSGTYKVDGNKLIMTKDGEEENADNYLVFEQNGNELKITDTHGNESALEISNAKDVFLPLVFTK